MARHLHIACFHIPDFPAVALARAERIDGDVIVVQKHSVISLTAGARARGVELGDSGQRAERLAPSAQILLRKYVVELSVWEEVLQALYTITPHIMELRMGTAVLYAMDAQKLRLFAAQYQACVGVASARLSAQLAAYSCEVGSLHFVDDSDVQDFLRNCPVELLRFFQIEEDILEKLQLFGLQSLSALAAITRRQLVAQFGKAGERIATVVQDLMRDRRAPLPFFQPPPLLHAHRSFELAVREPRELQAALRDMVTECQQELLSVSARQCCWIGLRFVNAKAVQRYARRILKQATSGIDAIRTAAEILLRTMMNGEECSELRFELGGLTQAQALQLSFVHERVEPAVIARKVEQRYPHSMFKAEVRNAMAYLAEDRFTLLPYAKEDDR